MEIQRIDDVGIAVRSIEAALILHQDILGGQFVLGTDDDTVGVRSLLLSYLSGIKIEPLQSTRPESFPERYLQKRGEMGKLPDLNPQTECGCTPQACAFRDHYQELQKLGAQVFGLSTQDTDYQQEAVTRLHLPFELLSDSELEFANRLRLPTFEIAGMRLIKRLTLIACDGEIKRVFYPVFPPDKNAGEVINWLVQYDQSN